MIKGSIPGDYLEWSIGEASSGWAEGQWSSGQWSNNITNNILWNTVNSVNIPNGNLWFYNQFTIPSTSFRFFGIRVKSTPIATSTIYLDRIDLYLPHREEREANIIQCNVRIDKNGYNSKMRLNQYDLFANDQNFLNERKIEILETIQQI
jgi:hypothetical protein